VIRYLITVNGPEPVSARTSAIDSQHYLDRQLAPVADGILHFLGNSFARLTATQLELFAIGSELDSKGWRESLD